MILRVREQNGKEVPHLGLLESHLSLMEKYDYRDVCYPSLDYGVFLGLCEVHYGLVFFEYGHRNAKVLSYAVYRKGLVSFEDWQTKS